MQKLDPLHHALMNKLAELKDGNHSAGMAEDSPDDPNHNGEPENDTDAAPSLPGHLQASQAQHGDETGEHPGAVSAIAGMSGNPFHAKAAAMAKEKMAAIEKNKKAKGM